MDMNQYLDIFMEESKENLQSMNDILMKLENEPKDMNLLNEIFRIAHTLKGMSGTMGFTNIASLTHEMENILDDVRNGTIDMNPEVIDLLFECFDELEKYANHIDEYNNEGDLDSHILIEKLKDLSNMRGGETKTMDKGEKILLQDAPHIKINKYVDSTVQRAIEKDFNAFLIKITLDEKCMLKSARAYIVISTLEKLAEIIHAEPDIEDIEDEKFDFSFELIIITKHNEEYIYKELEGISEIQSIEFTNLQDRTYSIELNGGDDKAEASLLENHGKTSNDMPNNLQEETNNKKSKTGKTVRVDIDRLDNLMNLVSELIIIKTRLEDIDDTDKKHGMNEATEHLERITTSLHDAVMKVRMVPIERVFNRFPRMVRDLSKELDKEISLILTGAETEVDRTVIDEIGDPLIHLIRNAIDHGIENAETRIKSNKNKKGVVKLSAYPDGNSVVIEVEDDGKGIDVEKVKAKAIEKNIISIQQSQLMEDHEIIQLLFAPGFSTADKISDISGRGVGLDVVKTKIEALGGVVEVNSNLGKGSKFVIRLPLTLAIIQALLVITGDEKYAIPLNNIKEITTIDVKNIRKVQDNEVILFRNSTLPILRLSNLLNIPNSQEDKEEITVVIVRKGDKIVGIVVDELIGQQEIVIKSLGKFLSNIKGIAGATILGNGSVALIIDTNSFF